MNLEDHEIVQFARANKAMCDAYVGKDGEFIVDTDNWNIRLMDGVTPGGKVIANLEFTDGRYQARSIELDGIQNFQDTDRGFLTRLGPATYRVRTLKVNTQALQLQNPDGYAGNPYLDFADNITRNISFGGVVTFTQQIKATAGVLGDVTGNLTGNVDGNVTGNLTGDSTGAHTGKQTGDVDVRGHTLQLDPGQIHLAALNSDVTDLIALGALKIGMILLWSGSVASIPVNYHLCDGTQGTPDLRNAFVVGAGDAYVPGDDGGQQQTNIGVTLTANGSHTHTLTVDDTTLTIDQMPIHHHGSGIGDASTQCMFYGFEDFPASGQTTNQMQQTTANGIFQAQTEPVGDSQPHGHDSAITTDGVHNHPVAVSQSDNRPPFYALAYIMKVS